VSKKTEKPRKPEKPNREKKPIKILKKPTSSVRFWFYKSETEKIESNRTQAEKTRKKLSQTGKNRARFEPVSVFLKKIRFGNFFFIKTKSNRK
jgi:hypothetical protein